jgi:hypothetical protein
LNTNPNFKFKELNVWQKAIEYAVAVVKTTEKLSTNRQHYKLIEQLESCCSSIAQNIAEGKGRYSKKEFQRFLFIAIKEDIPKRNSSVSFLLQGALFTKA